MLHAVLHHKLDESIPEPQRLEDALTSTVFGTLVLVGADEVLRAWLEGEPAVTPAPEPEAARPVECWFWPRLMSAEPDVLVRAGHALFVVEAKYRSGRHDLPGMATDEQPDAGDQFRRQHDSISTPPEQRTPYAEPIERCIAECRASHVFLVDAHRMRQTQREFRESRAALPADARLVVRTWQGLYRLINTIRSRPDAPRWVADLLRYLDLCNLGSFVGLRPERMVPAAVSRTVVRWPSLRTGPAGRLKAAMSRAMNAQTNVLMRWRSCRGDRRRGGGFSARGWRTERELLAPGMWRTASEGTPRRHTCEASGLAGAVRATHRFGPDPLRIMLAWRKGRD